MYYRWFQQNLIDIENLDYEWNNAENACNFCYLKLLIDLILKFIKLLDLSLFAMVTQKKAYSF